jgi:hypothetical protein
MVLKISGMLALMSLILLFDLRFFFPVAIIVLFILNSIEKQLKRDERKRSLVKNREFVTEE